MMHFVISCFRPTITRLLSTLLRLAIVNAYTIYYSANTAKRIFFDWSVETVGWHMAYGFSC